MTLNSFFKILLVAVIALFMTVLITKCGYVKERILIQRIQNHLIKKDDNPDYRLPNFKKITPFDYDSVFLFGYYSSPSRISKDAGVPVKDAQSHTHGIEYRDTGPDLYIFVRKNRIISSISHEFTGQCYLDNWVRDVPFQREIDPCKKGTISKNRNRLNSED